MVESCSRRTSGARTGSRRHTRAARSVSTAAPSRPTAHGGVRRVAAAARGAGRAAAARARVRGSPLGRRRPARLRRPPRRLGDDRSAADRRNGAARAARPASRLGRRQAERAHALDRRAVGRRDGPAPRSACSTAPCSTPRRSRPCCSARRATRSTPRSTRGCSPSTRDGDLALPETVQGLIAARIDGLAPEEKALLQDASVIGKVFWPGALAGQRRARTPRARAEGVRPARPPLRRSRARRSTPSCTRSSATSPTGRFPARDRAEKHRRAAEWLASLAGDRSEDHAEMLAHHYREALALVGGRRTGREPLCAGPRDALRGGGAAGALARRRRRRVRACVRGARADRRGTIRSGRRFSSSPPTGGRDLADADVTGLLDEAVDGFLALGDTGRAAEAAQVLAREFFHRGDVSRADDATAAGRSSLRVRSALSTATARAIAGHARHVVVASCRDTQRAPISRARRSTSPTRRATTRLAMHALNTIGMARVYSGDVAGLDDLERRGRAWPGRRRGVRAGDGAQQPRQHARRPSAVSTRATARLDEARELCERYGITAGIVWNEGERVYQRDRRGDLEGTIGGREPIPCAAVRGGELPATPRARYPRPCLPGPGPDHRGCRRRRGSTGGHRGVEHRCADRRRGSSPSALAAFARPVVPRRRSELLQRALAATYDALVWDLALQLVELGRGDEFLARPE